MGKITYRLNVGNWSIDSANDPLTEFLYLEVQRSMDQPADSCRITVYAPPPTKAGLLDQAIGEATGALGLGDTAAPSFAVQVRGNEIKPGDAMTVELTAGDRSDKVMTADVQAIHSTFSQTTVVGATGMQKLANTRLNQVFENQSMQQIVNDLAGQAGINGAEIETGSTYPIYIVYEAKSLLGHVRELAMRDGLDLYFDTDNRLTLTKFNKSSADHAFYFGIDILDLQLFNQEPGSHHVRTYGESPSSNQGADTWPWLVKDISPYQSEVGEGAKLLTLQDGTVRTKDAADQLAMAKYGAIKDQSAWGRLKVMGNPNLKVADAIEIKNAPKPELNGLFKVTSVRHVLNKRDGFITVAGFSGQGGAEAAGGLLGAAGALAGAIGL